MMRSTLSYVDGPYFVDIVLGYDNRFSLDDSSEQNSEISANSSAFSSFSVNQILECILLFIGELKRTYL